MDKVREKGGRRQDRVNDYLVREKLGKLTFKFGGHPDIGQLTYHSKNSVQTIQFEKNLNQFGAVYLTWSWREENQSGTVILSRRSIIKSYNKMTSHNECYFT